MKYTQDEIYSLVKKLSELEVSQLTIKSEDLTIKIKHGTKSDKAVKKELKASREVEESNQEPIILEEKPGKAISAPINGTFYSSPGPDEPAYVKAGDKVKKGEPVCILEAMKMMNTINMPEDGIILSVEVTNEDIVDSGQPLVRYDAL